MEKTVKKKFTKTILSLMMVFVFMLSGCALFPRDVNAYLEKSVCTITYTDGKVEEITTEAFINAYNSYGASLVQNGTETDEAIEKTLEVLISRYVLLNHAKKTVSIKDDEEEIFDNVYSSLVSSLDNYIDTVKHAWGLEHDHDHDHESEDSDDSEDVVKYTAYEKTAEVVYDNGTLRIKLLSDESEPSTHFTSIQNVINAFKDYANPTDTTNSSKIKKEAYRRFIATLRANEEGRGKSVDSDSVLNRYANKLLENYQENAYIEALEEYYKSDKQYSTITVKQVLDKYKALVLESKYKYENDSSAYDTAMLSSFKDVYYVADDNYFFVSNLLIKFTDEQKTEYSNIESSATGTTVGNAQKKAALVEGIMATVRDSDGKVIENEKISAKEVYNNLKKELDNAKTNDQKTEIFKKYLYKYGEDTGTQNADYMYVIGTSTSQMVESFTNASRELNDDGNYGAISELVTSEYGVHIIFYGGKVENLFNVSDLSTFTLQEEDIWKLCEAKLNQLNNKTVFDKVFETLSDDNYSIFENMNLAVLKKDLRIQKHQSVLDNL